MKVPRRKSLQLAVAAAALPALSRFAWGQTYPTRPVRIVVPFAPAGTTDIAARLMGQWLSERLGQQFIVENRPGANGNIGTEAVVRAPSDGYTLLVVDASPAINATLYDKLNFNFVRDTAPVGSVVRVPLILVVHPSVPAKTVPEFIAYAKANPGRINYGSAGIGSTLHVTGELFKIMTGVDLVHVPYRGGGPAIADLIGGQVQAVFIPAPAGIEYVRGGTIRALAVTAASRFVALPDLPTIGEHVPSYESTTWYGVLVPRNTASTIIDSLNKEINAGLADSKLKAQFAGMGAEVLPGSPADFGMLIAAETEGGQHKGAVKSGAKRCFILSGSANPSTPPSGHLSTDDVCIRRKRTDEGQGGGPGMTQGDIRASRLLRRKLTIRPFRHSNFLL